MTILRSLALVISAGCYAGQSPGSDESQQPHVIQGAGAGARENARRTTGPTADQLAERARLAASGRYLAPLTQDPPGSRAGAPRATLGPDPDCVGVSWAQALDFKAPDLVTAVLDGPTEAAAIRSNLGVIKPIHGPCFILLSTGKADVGQPGSLTIPEPGTDFDLSGVVGDAVTLSLTLDVPLDADTMSLQYNFLSTESPDFTGTNFNDTFSIQLIQDGTPSCTPGGTPSCDVASVNSSQFFDVSESRARDSGFDLFTADPLGVDTVFGGGLPDAGLTDFQLYTAKVSPGAHLTLRLTIQDNGDGMLDSAVLLDAVEFSSLQAVDPNANPNTSAQLVIQAGDAAGTITQNIDNLVQQGQPSRGVIADGATELVLRMKIPQAPTALCLGSTDFSLLDANDGSLRQTDAPRPLDGAAAVTLLPSVPVVKASDGQCYAVVVYRAPLSFDRNTDDNTLVERTTQVKATFTGDDGSTLETSADLQIRRPPVVLVRGIWTQPDDWLPDPQFADSNRFNDQRFVLNNPVFSVSREDGLYSCNPEVQVVPLGPITICNQTGVAKETCKAVTTSAIASAIQGALDNTRRLGIAATKVDVVAHGTGGLRVREYIDTGHVDSNNIQQNYKNPANLMQGDINRLITVNTPHLGMLMADQVVQARDHATGPPLDLCKMRESLSPVEPDDIDRAKATNISLLSTPVPSHAIIGSGGAALTNDPNPLVLNSFKDEIQPKLLLFHARALGTFVAPALRASIALYKNAFGLCDHDLMVDVVSQQGGIALAATSTVPMTDESAIIAANKADPQNAPPISENDPDSDYFRAMRSPDVNVKITSLLTSRPEDGKFALFPATSDAHICDKTTGLPNLAALPPAATPPLPKRSAGPSPLDATGGLRIVSPADGTVVSAGDRIQVQVASDGGFVPVTVMTSAGGPVERSDMAPFTTEVVIPPGVVGPLRVSAIAFDANDEAVFADDVTLKVTTTAVVQAVRILTQDPILYEVGEQRQLSVFADYSDDLTRSISSGATGTVYLTSNPEVVTVSGNGVITAVRSGSATVIAQNGGAQDSITVTVKANATPVVIAGADTSFRCNLPGALVPVHLDGSASFDPDGDEVSFAWFENGVKLATGPTPIVTLGVGIHTLDLVVSDGISLPGHNSVTVSILPYTEPPVVTVLGDNPRSVECIASYIDDGATASDACDGDLTSAIVAESHVDTRIVGSYTVDYQVRDHAGLTGTASRTVRVVDHAPPDLVIAPMQQLFPSDNRFRTFDLSNCATAIDSCGGPLNVDNAGEIIAIHSDEQDSSGPGDREHDIVIVTHSQFKLRNQANRSGNGRVYEIEFAVHDQSGNTTGARSCFIGVRPLPHSGTPIDDGRVFTVRP